MSRSTSPPSAGLWNRLESHIRRVKGSVLKETCFVLHGRRLRVRSRRSSWSLSTSRCSSCNRCGGPWPMLLSVTLLDIMVIWDEVMAVIDLRWSISSRALQATYLTAKLRHLNEIWSIWLDNRVVTMKYYVISIKILHLLYDLYKSGKYVLYNFLWMALTKSRRRSWISFAKHSYLICNS